MHPDELRLLKNLKNQYAKTEKSKKKKYEQEMLKRINSRWKYINDSEEEKTPVQVKVDGIKTTKQRTIANAYGDHLLAKVENLTKNSQMKRKKPLNYFRN